LRVTKQKINGSESFDIVIWYYNALKYIN